jgi:hypothetical protein
VFNDLPKLQQFAIVGAKFFISLFAVWFVVVFALGGMPRVRLVYHRIAGLITGREFKQPGDTPTDAEPNAVAGAAPASSAGKDTDDEWLYGDWILASSRGEDGRTVCSDFSSPRLYRLNGETGSIQTFRRNGEFRSILVYKTPDGMKHYTVTKARWKLDHNNIKRANIVEGGRIKKSGTSDAGRVRRHGANVMTIGDRPIGRFVRCSGGTSGTYGD